MSRPMNMLRTRRKDTNVKPNRREFRVTRLDRKSSRGMIYENEDLRLKTININAEVESRQSDIKKLKRENEMLKKGLWYLRDEYDKLEKLVKDKKNGLSSSSTSCSTSSDSDGCSSFSEASEEVETAQNLTNVQRTNMKNLHDHFDLLSVVTEETSAADNSEPPSNRSSTTRGWEDGVALGPDQSYPDHRITKSQTMPAMERAPGHFFAPIHASRSFDYDHRVNHQGVPQVQETALYPGELYSDGGGFFQNVVLLAEDLWPGVEARAMEKASTDLIVKLDNRSFGDVGDRSTVSSGGNLEQLLHDIESISQRGPNDHPDHNGQLEGFGVPENTAYPLNPVLMDLPRKENEEAPTDKPFKSELSVVLMPNPMPLIGIDKYRNIQRSLESLNAKPLEELSASHQDLCVIPPPPQPCPDPLVIPSSAPAIAIHEPEVNPFFFGNFKDNYVNSELFGAKYGSENFFMDTKQKQATGTDQTCGTKADLISKENDENLKFKTTKASNNSDSDKPKDETKSDKLSIRKKVCIHFKGKKDRSKTPNFNSDSSIPRTPDERKPSIWTSRDKAGPPEPPGKPVPESKTPSSSDSKTSNDKKSCTFEKKDSGSDKKEYGNEKKTTKSSSASPERKHVQLKEDATIEAKKHRNKHKRTTERARLRRQSTLADAGRSLRERSFSVCTDRSNMLEHRLGGFGSGALFEDFSDRERTNSASSCETADNARKMSMMPNVPLSGKVPWCGCWGNGCL